ncbi:hypothetical protein U1Q18_040853 [Sarracenia purpurea var. burkii]
MTSMKVLEETNDVDVQDLEAKASVLEVETRVLEELNDTDEGFGRDERYRCARFGGESEDFEGDKRCQRN